MQEKLAYITQCIKQAMDQSKKQSIKLKKSSSLYESLRRFSTELNRLYKTLTVTTEIQGISEQVKLREKVVELYAVVNSYGGKPTESQLYRMKLLQKEIQKANSTFKSILQKNLKKINTKLKSKKLKPIKIPTPEEFKKTE